MTSIKPSVPKGTRDFSPTEMAKRNYIFDTIKSVFRKYGYQQIETPSMENLSTLMGKYGDEGDKLIFKILNNGNFIDRKEFMSLSLEMGKYIHDLHTNDEVQEAINRPEIVAIQERMKNVVETEIALRYDLTVPFARYEVMLQNDITFPFKRFQVQFVLCV